MVTLDSALDDIMQLDFESREMLLEILKKRQIEARRDQMLRNAEEALEEYRAGKLTPMSAEELIEKLNKF